MKNFVIFISIEAYDENLIKHVCKYIYKLLGNKSWYTICGIILKV